MAIIFLKNQLFLILALLCLLGAGWLGSSIERPPLEVSKQESAINLSSNFLKFFHLGQSRLLADTMWIATLLESDHEHYKEKDLNSWLYLRFKSISILDPYFLENYRFGGKYLSIIKDDLEGAAEIFEKGLTYYPDDYELLFNAAFLYGFEIRDSKRAYELYTKVLEFPEAPDYIKTITLKLHYESFDNLDFAFSVLSEALKSETSEFLQDRIKTDLYAIKAQRDLECLNSGDQNCERRDYEGNAYFLKNGRYISRKEFEPYGIKRRKPQDEASHEKSDN